MGTVESIENRKHIHMTNVFKFTTFTIFCNFLNNFIIKEQQPQAKV